MEQVSCKVCGNDDSSDYCVVKDRLQISDESFRIVECVCGFVFLCPRPSELEIDRYYNDDDYGPYGHSGMIGALYRLAQKITFRIKLSIINRYVSAGRHLDIGGGKGEFCNFLRSKGWDSEIFERSDVNVEGFKRVANLSDIEASYDLITMWHSLEHLHSPNKVLSKIHSSLNKEGRLVIAVPNINAPEKKYFGSDWAPYDAPRHLYHFSLDSIVAMLNNNNLEVISSYPMYQDTIYNTLLSTSTSTKYAILYKLYIIVISMFKEFLMGPRYASSFIIICTK